MQSIQTLPIVAANGATVTGELLADDNGHLYLHLTGVCGTDKCEHRVTLGAADGNDALGSDAVQMQNVLQAALDDARKHVCKVLAVRSAARSVAAQLR